MLGKCNQNCFYCLGNEMPKAKLSNYNNTHFNEWIDFNKFVGILHERKINEVYLSSTTTEPMLYQYIDELVDYLHDNHFIVGIRTNGTVYGDIFKKLDGEISISVNSFNNDTSKLICNRQSNYQTVCQILENMQDLGKTIRISILVNKYNVNEIEHMVSQLKPYSKTIDYIQLRRWYTLNNTADNTPYDNLVEKIKNNFKHIGNFYESQIYDVHDMKVSLWNNVFKRESVHSVNYFPDGKISDHNLLIPIYENNYNLL